MSFHNIFFNPHPIQDIRTTQSMDLLCSVKWEKARREMRLDMKNKTWRG